MPLTPRIKVAERQLAVFAFVQGEPDVVAPEVVEALQFSSTTEASRYLKALAEGGLLVRTDEWRNRRGIPEGEPKGRTSPVYRVATRDEAAAVTDPSPSPPATAPLPEISEEKLKAVRDVVVGLTVPFSPAQVTEHCPVTTAEAEAALLVLESMSVVKNESLGDMMLFEYVPPKEPGRAAELDAQRAKERAAQEIAEPVAGTGNGKVRVSPKAMQDLVDKCETQHPGCARKQGNNHVVITNPTNGKRVLIGSTQKGSSGALHKTRKRMRDAGFDV
jgi:hypothetical protein